MFGHSVAGELAMLLSSGANHDPQIFKDPDDFRPGRENVSYQNRDGDRFDGDFFWCDSINSFQPALKLYEAERLLSWNKCISTKSLNRTWTDANAFADASPSHHDQGVGRLQDLPHSGRLPCCTSRLSWHLPVNAHSQGDGTSLSMSHQILSLAFAVAARMALKATQLMQGQLLYRRNWEDFEIWNWRALNALLMVPRCF